jgi:uncharacterized protein YjbI with pentapeptide repeats
MKSQNQIVASDTRVEDFSGDNWDSDILDLLQSDDAEVRKAHLSGAQLPYANLTGMNLSEADLSSANLSYANLSQCDLRNANLKEANLDHADLRAADLRGSDLSMTKLNHTKVSGAIFNTETKLTIDKRDAILAGMVFMDSDGEPDIEISYES